MLNLSLTDLHISLKNKNIKVVRGWDLNLRGATSKANALTAAPPLLRIITKPSDTRLHTRHSDSDFLFFIRFLGISYLDGVDQSLHIGIDDNQYQLPVS